MSKIKLTGESSGYVEISAGANAGNNTLDLPSGKVKLVGADSSDNIVVGIVTAVNASFSGDVSVGGVLTYDDVTNIDSVGVVTARSGLHVTSGLVGIGTDNPTTKLHITGNASNTAALSDTVTDYALKFDSAITSNYFSNAICFAEGNNVNASIASFDGGSGGAQGLVFGTGPSNTERLRVDSSGDVGIGTNNPNRTLHVQGDFGLSGRAYIGDVNQTTSNLRDSQTTVNRTPKVQINSESGPSSGLALITWHGDPGGYYSPHLWLAKSNASDNAVGTNTLVTNGTDLGTINFAGNDGATFLNAASIRGEVDGTAATDDMPGRLVFFTNSGAVDPTERMRIDSNGLVGIGTDNPTEELHIAAPVPGIRLEDTDNGYDGRILQSGASLYLDADFNNVGSGAIRFRVGGSDEKMRIDSAGNVGIATDNPTEKLHVIGNILASGNITAFSDIKLKDNIEVIPNALDKVVQIRGVTFDRVDEEVPRQSGVIAQEVEKVLPEVVITNKDGIKSVAYGNLVGLLIESIKELKVEVNELKARLEE